jgi:putative adhesin/cell wall-active antibiotic response 4TMS protein YvqF
MSVRRSAGGIFWGVTLMTIGALLLARNMGYAIPIWTTAARYWPLLLIVWGVLKVVDYIRFTRAGDNRPLFSGGEVALLIMVILVGGAITTAANLSPDVENIFQLGDLDLWDITGNNFEYSEHQEADVPAGSTIEIVNLYGDVDVHPSDTNRVVLDVRKTIRAAQKADADRYANDFTFSIRNEGSRYRILSSRDEGGRVGRSRQYYKSSMTILVPKQSAIQVDNRNGKVTVENLAGTQNITNRYGQVEVRGIMGAVEVENRNGSVTVEDVSDAVKITDRYSEVNAKNIGGSLQIANRNGSVYVSEVRGNTTISNAYGPITAENITGDLTLNGRNNSIEAEHVSGRVTADASYQNVTIRDASGPITVRNRNGDVVVGFVKPPDKDVSVVTQYSNVRLELPPAASFNIDARTQHGSVDSEFDGVETGSSNRDRTLKGQVGRGGPSINIETRNGDIRVEKRG